MIPSQPEVLSWFDALSNWGRWGFDDRLGTLNHLTPERRRAAPPSVRWRPQESYPGWQASALPWLFQHDVAAIGANTAQESLPSGYPEVPMPVHYVGIVAMGLCLVDNCDLEALAAACEQAGRWDFLFMLAPLRLVGLSGSPANPLAII